MTTWIEKRACRESNLRNASAIWQEAKSAIDDCCESFRQHYAGLARVINQEQNGHRVAITILFHSAPSHPRHVSVVFSSTDNTIRVTVDGEKAILFPIEADETHAFITFQDKEINAEDFTQWALEDALFESPDSKLRIASM